MEITDKNIKPLEPIHLGDLPATYWVNKHLGVHYTWHHNGGKVKALQHIPKDKHFDLGIADSLETATKMVNDDYYPRAILMLKELMIHTLYNIPEIQ
jgi:hypothetical protein